MEDQELEALRAKRMAEMQAKAVSNVNIRVTIYNSVSGRKPQLF